MLLDPFEEQFHLPTAAVELGDGQRGQGEVVGQEDEAFAGLRIVEVDAAQRRLEVLERVEAGEHDGLIADHPGASVDRARVATLGLEVRLGAGHKEAARLVETEQALEVDDSHGP